MMAVLAYGPQFLQGTAVTLAMALAALIVGTAIGMLIGWTKVYGPQPLRYAAEVYTAIVRGVPELIVIYLVYFGSTVALTRLVGRYVDINGFTAGVFALSFIFGAYAGDIFRGAIRQVPKGQTEAANALGLTRRIVFLRVVLPQAWRIALPAFGNLSIVLLKQTSLISVIGLQELLRASAIVSGATREPFDVFAVTAVIYLVLTGVASIGLRRMRLRADRGYA